MVFVKPALVFNQPSWPTVVVSVAVGGRIKAPSLKVGALKFVEYNSEAFAV